MGVIDMRSLTFLLCSLTSLASIPGAAAPLTDSSGYAVTVLTQPSDPSQTCLVSNGSSTVASNKVTDVVVTCTTTVLEPEFDSDPPPDDGIALDFGSTLVNVETANQYIYVSNLGSADLTLDCDASTDKDFRHFNLKDCSSPISAGSSGVIAISCEPSSTGTHYADLFVYTNVNASPNPQLFAAY